MDMDFRAIATRVASGTTEAARKRKKTKKSRKPRKSRKSRKPRTSKPKKPVAPDPFEDQDEDISTDDILKPKTEYSCQLQVSVIADFEGDVDQNKLKKKLKNEIINAIKSGVAVTAREYRLEATQITVQPIGLECAVNSIE